MSDQNTIFILTRDDVIGIAEEMGMPPEVITDEVLHQVKKGVEWGLCCWPDVMQEAINFALKSGEPDGKICPSCGKPVALCLCVSVDDH